MPNPTLSTSVDLLNLPPIQIWSVRIHKQCFFLFCCMSAFASALTRCQNTSHKCVQDLLARWLRLLIATTPPLHQHRATFPPRPAAHARHRPHYVNAAQTIRSSRQNLSPLPKISPIFLLKGWSQSRMRNRKLPRLRQFYAKSLIVSPVIGQYALMLTHTYET